MKEDIVIRIDFGTMADVQEKIIPWCTRYFGEPVFIRQPEKIVHIRQEMNEYFAGNRYEFTFSYMFYGTPFQKAVWTALTRDIHYEETKTYKYIAQEIQNERAVSDVGGAVNKNPFSIVVHRHLVIEKSDKIGE